MNFLKEVTKKIILFFLSIKVIYVLKKIDLNKKNLFIDLGTNMGQGFNYFKKFFKLEKFDYLLVEPNPNLKDEIEALIKKNNYKNNISFINKAAYIKNTKTKLFGTVEDKRGKISEGASIINVHNSNLYNSDYENGLWVDTFDIIQEIKNLNSYDSIIIKMDIEGAEYDILEELIIQNNKIKNLKHIFIEFHSRFMDKVNKKKFKIRENKIKQELKRINLEFTIWI